MLNPTEKFEYRRCERCGNIFLSGIEPDAAFFGKYYGPDYYGTAGVEAGPKKELRTSGLAALEHLYGRVCFARKVRLILRYLKKPNKEIAPTEKASSARGFAPSRAEDSLSSGGRQSFAAGKQGSISTGSKIRILDIGCGGGAFLESLDPAVFDKSGLEINPQGADICERKGIKVYRQDIRATDFGEQKFDVVTLWHVLEHTAEPVSLIKRVRQILHEDGVIVLSVPNTGGLGYRFGREWWFHVDAPRHLFLPGPGSMRRLFQEAGLATVCMIPTAMEYPLDLFWSVRRSGTRLMVWALYPLCKSLSPETLTYVVK